MYGEIFICRFPYSSGAAGKPRPVLVLFDFQQDVILCKITSAMRNGPRDVVLADWAPSGLAMPSVARLDKLMTAEKLILGRRLGQLSVPDEDAVRAAWNQHMNL